MHCDKMGYVLTLCHFPLLAWHFLLACHFHVCEKGSRGRGERGERDELHKCTSTPVLLYLKFARAKVRASNVFRTHMP